MNENIDLTLDVLFLRDKQPHLRYLNHRNYERLFERPDVEGKILGKTEELFNLYPSRFKYKVGILDRYQGVLSARPRNTWEDLEEHMMYAPKTILGIITKSVRCLGNYYGCPEALSCDCCGVELNPLNKTHGCICYDCNQDLELTAARSEFTILGMKTEG